MADKLDDWGELKTVFESNFAILKRQTKSDNELKIKKVRRLAFMEYRSRVIKSSLIS